MDRAERFKCKVAVKYAIVMGHWEAEQSNVMKNKNLQRVDFSGDPKQGNEVAWDLDPQIYPIINQDVGDKTSRRLYKPRPFK